MSSCVRLKIRKQWPSVAVDCSWWRVSARARQVSRSKVLQKHRKLVGDLMGVVVTHQWRAHEYVGAAHECGTLLNNCQ